MRIIELNIVGAFIFSKDGYILLGKSIAGGVYSDTWIVPGGGIEPGETKLEAVKREVLEEVGLAFDDEQFLPLGKTETGESEKTLKDTGERVLMTMSFYDYRVDVPDNAAAIQPTPGDDFAQAKWIPLTQLPTISMTQSMQRTLKMLDVSPNS